MKTIKKAQTGVKQKPAAKSPVKKGPRRTTSGMWVDEDKFTPPFDVTYPNEKPKVKAKAKVVKPKAKNGTIIPKKNSVSKNVGNLNKAKSGTSMKKCKYGCK